MRTEISQWMVGDHDEWSRAPCAHVVLVFRIITAGAGGGHTPMSYI